MKEATEIDTTIPEGNWVAVPINEEDNNLILRKDNALETFYDYLIKEKSGDPIPFQKSDVLGICLEILGGSGGIYSWPPALKYGESRHPFILHSFVITNPLSNVLFLIKATDDLFDTIQGELQVPDALKDLIDIPSKKDLAIKYIKMGLGSVFCVIPFGAVAYLFPLPNCTETWCLSLTISHAILTNIILHAVSWAFILRPDFWYYRLPILPFEKLYRLIKDYYNSESELEFLRLTYDEEKIYEKYKKILIENFLSTTEQIIEEFLTEFNNNKLCSLTENELSFANFPLLSKEKTVTIAEQSYLTTTANKVHDFFLQGGMGFIGAGIMVTGCIGWIANPFYIASVANFTLPAVIFSGALPSYSTAVLCAFYGSAILTKIYSYFTNWDESKFSPEARMYPATFTVFLAINLYISIFAYATGVQLINTIFSDKMWDGYREALADISMVSLQVLSFIPLVDLFNLVIRKVTAKAGSLEKDHTIAARLLLKSSIMVSYLQKMKGSELIASLCKYLPEEQLALGLDINEFVDDIKKLKDLNTEKSKYYSSANSNLLFQKSTKQIYSQHLIGYGTDSTLSKIDI